MNGKIDVQQSFTQNRWFRLGTSVMLAFGLAVSLLLLPVLLTQTVEEQPRLAHLEQGADNPAQPNWESSVLLGVNELLGTNQAQARKVKFYDTLGITITKVVVTQGATDFTKDIATVFQLNDPNKIELGPSSVISGGPGEVEAVDFVILVETNTPYTDVVVIDQVPDGVSCVNAVDTNQPVGVSWGVSSDDCRDDRVARYTLQTGVLQPGQVYPLRFTVRPFTYNNSIVTNNVVTVTANKKTQLQQSIGQAVSVKAPMYVITKTALTSGVSNGDTVQYTINLGNAGGTDMFVDAQHPITIVDVLPFGIISSTNKPIVTLAPNVVNKGDSGTDSTGYTLTLAITGAPDGKNPFLTATHDFQSIYQTPVATVTFTLTNSSLTSGESFTNTVMVHGGLNVANVATDTAEVFYFEKPSQLTIAKTVVNTSAVSGENFTYTIHFTAGAANLAKVVLTDTISEVVKFADFVDVTFQKIEGAYSFLDSDKKLLQIRTTKPLTANTDARAIVRFKAHTFITPGLVVTNILKIEDVTRVASDTVFAGGFTVLSVPVTISSFNKIVFTKTLFARNPNKNGIVEELQPDFPNAYVKPGEIITYRLVLANEGTGRASVSVQDSLMPSGGFQFVNGSIVFPGGSIGSLNQSGVFILSDFYLNENVVLTSGTDIDQRVFQFSAVAPTTNLSTEPYTNNLSLDYIQFKKPATSFVSVNSPANNPVRVLDTVITVTKEAVKTSAGPYVELGDVITYTYKITNGSSITLTDLKIVDYFKGTTVTTIMLPQTDLAPDGALTATYIYTTTRENLLKNAALVGTAPNVSAYLSNTVVVTGVPKLSGITNITVVGTDTFGYPITDAKRIEISKTVVASDTVSAMRGFASVGSQITYVYTIENQSIHLVQVATIKDDKIDKPLFGGNKFDLQGYGVKTDVLTITLTEADIATSIKPTPPATMPFLVNTFSVSSTQYFPNSNSPVNGNKPSVTASVPISYTAGFEYIKKVITPATVGKDLEFQIFITNTGGVTLTLANPFTDFLPSLRPGLADVYTASSGIEIPPSQGLNVASKYVAGSHNIGSFPLTSAVAITNQNTSPGTSALTAALTATLINAVFTPQLRIDNTISTTFKPLYDVLTGSGTIDANTGVVIANVKALSATSIADSSGVTHTIPSVTVPLTYTAGVTIAKYVVLSDGTQAIATNKIAVGDTDLFTYRYYVTNTGQVPLVITLTDIVTTSNLSSNPISGTYVLYNPDGSVSNGPLGKGATVANPSGTGTYTKPLQAKTGMHIDVTSIFSKAAFSNAGSGRSATVSNTAALLAYVVNLADPNLATNPTLVYTLAATSNSVSVTSKLDTLLAIEKVAFVNGVRWNKDTSPPARWGDVVTYQVHISNTGDLVITNINFVDTTPLGQQFTIKDSAVTTLTQIAASPNVLTTGLFTLPKQSSVTLLITEPGKLNDEDLRRSIGNGVGPGQGLGDDRNTPQLEYRNFVTATGFVSGTTSSISANTNGFTETIYLTFTNSVTMDKVASVGQAFVGDKIIYTYTIRNNGDIGIALVEVLDESQVEAQKTVAITGDFIEAIFGNPILPPSSTVVLTYSFTPDENEFSYIQNNYNGQLTNTAKAVATPTIYIHSDVVASGLVTPAMPTATAMVMLTSETGIDIEKTADWPGKAMSQPATIGQMVTYTYRITNTGRISFEARFNTITNSSSINLIDDKLGSLTADVPVAQALVFDPQEVVTVMKTIEISYAELAYYPLLTNTAQVTGYTSAASPNAAANTKRNPTEVPLTYTADFEVSKVSSVLSGSIVLLGDPITYTITISNNSPLTTNFAISDVYVSNPNKPAAGNGTIPVSIVLGPRAITHVTYVDRALPGYLDKPQVNQKEPMTNVVTVVANDNGAIINQTKSATVGVVVSYTLDVDVSKVANTNKVEFNKPPVSVTYNYVITNNGTTPVTLIDFVDTFGGGRPNSAIVTGPAVIPPKTPVSYSLTISVDEKTDLPVISNIAQAVVVPGSNLTATQGITLPSNNNLPVTVTVNFTPSLRVVKSVDRTMIPSLTGETVTYTFLILNDGAVTVDDIVINDSYFGQITATNSTMAPGNQVAHFKSLTLSPIDIVRAKENGGFITNTATAIGGRAGITVTSDPSNVVTVTLSSERAVSLTKTVNMTTASPGDIVVYTFEVLNTGGLTLTNVVLNDSRLDLTNLSVAPVLPVGSAPVVLTRAYQIKPNDPSPLVNTAFVSADDTKPAQGEATVILTGTATNPFTFNVVAKPSEVSAGSVVEFMIEDLTPQTTTIVSYVWDFGDGSPSVSGTQLDQTHTYPTPGTYTVVVTGTSDTNQIFVDTVVVTVSSQDNRLVPTKTANPASGSSVTPASSTITYILGVTNVSTETVSGFALVDTLPVGLDLLDNGGGMSSNNVLTFAGITLEPGQATSRTIVVSVTNEASGDLVNRVVAKTAKGLSDVATVTHTVNVTGGSGLNITKTVDLGGRSALSVGDTFTYTIVVANDGTDPQTGLVITDVIPSMLDVVSAGIGTQSPTNTVVADIAALNPGDSPATLVIVVKVNETARGAIEIPANVAVVSSDQQGDKSDVSQAVPLETGTTIFLPIILKQPTIVVPGEPNLQSKVEVNPAQPGSGQPATITVIVTNVGDAPVTDAFWVDLYIDPSSVPSQGGRWNDFSEKGIAWRIETEDFGGSLEAKSSITLVSVVDGSAPAGQIGFDLAQTTWDNSFAAGAKTVYAYADSYDDSNEPAHLVAESNETDNLSEVYSLTNTGSPLSTGSQVLPNFPPRRGF